MKKQNNKMDIISKHHEKLLAVDNEIAWHNSTLKTVKDGDYYRRNQHIQEVEIKAESEKLRNAHLKKQGVIRQYMAALDRADKTNSKILCGTL